MLGSWRRVRGRRVVVGYAEAPKWWTGREVQGVCKNGSGDKIERLSEH